MAKSDVEREERLAEALRANLRLRKAQARNEVRQAAPAGQEPSSVQAPILRELSPHLFVAGQIEPQQVPLLANRGFRMIINNRPDGEEPGQPPAYEVRAAAEAAGLAYVDIPVTGGFAPVQVEAMAAELARADGPVLAFCRSGTRSTFLWALAEASRGVSGEDLIRNAAAAGYDLEPIAACLRG